MKHFYLIFQLLCLTSLLIGPLTQAANLPSMNDAPAEKRMGGKPPSDAIEMCVGKSENSACTMNGPRGEEQGFCEHTPDKLYFACNPQRGPAKQSPNAMPPQDNNHQSQHSTNANPKVTYFPIDRES